MIVAKGLTKYFGKTQVLKNVSFHLQPGEVVGFVGLNGAGKTTTLRILCGILNADKGQVQIAGHDIDSDREAACKCIGYMPEGAPLYEDMRVSEYLRFRATLKGLESHVVKTRVEEFVELLELKENYRKLISRLSKGFRQRVALADALLSDPKVLLLDEPTSGLDPVQRGAFRDLLQTISKERCVLFSSHVLPEVAALVSRFLVLHRGKLVADGDLQELQDLASLSSSASAEAVFGALVGPSSTRKA